MIAYRVVAVPERLALATELAQHVGGTVVLDAEHEGAFPTHVRALRSAAGADHVVVLEDDAIVCGDFTSHVRGLIAERPTHLLGLYVGRQWPRRVQGLLSKIDSRSQRWLDEPALTRELWWAVGYVMPMRDLPAVLAELDAGYHHPWLHTDRRIGAWHAAQGRLSYPFPSPVDHDDTIPSTMSKAKQGRVAWAHCEGQAP